MFSWIIVIISIVVVAVAVGSGAQTYSWVKGAQSVEGKVVELVEKKKRKKNGGTGVTYAPRVTYQINGDERSFLSSRSSSPPDFAVGDAVRVAVNMEKGEESIATFGELYGFSIVGTCLGAALALAVVIIMNGDKVLRFIHPNLHG